MTTRHAHDTAQMLAQLNGYVQGGDTLILHAGVYGALDSYATNVQGGISWTKKLTIRVYKQDRVVFRAVAGDMFCLRLAHPINRYIEFVGIEFDGSDVEFSAVKVTHSNSADENGSAARFIRFTDCAIHSSRLSCVLVTSPNSRVEFIRCDIYGAGRPTTDGSSSHAVYAPGGGVLISKSRLHDCTGQGACFYSAGPEQNGEALPVASRIEWSQAWALGRAGILLAGQGDTAEGNTVVDCETGLHVWPTARGWTEKSNRFTHNGTNTYVDPAEKP